MDNWEKQELTRDVKQAIAEEKTRAETVKRLSGWFYLHLVEISLRGKL